MDNIRIRGDLLFSHSIKTNKLAVFKNVTMIYKSPNAYTGHPPKNAILPFSQYR